MSINLPTLLERFRAFNDFENEVASYRTLVPWVGPEAYLNIIFRGASAQLLSDFAGNLCLPVPIIAFLAQHNGAKLFSGSLNLYGVVEPGRLLNRRDSFSLPPYNIDGANRSWSVDPQRLLVIGGYQFDGSQVCIDRTSGQILFFKKKRATPDHSWTTLESWLQEEISRLCSLFDSDGRRLCPASETVPCGKTGRVH
jgi:hypothetical protein